MSCAKLYSLIQKLLQRYPIQQYAWGKDINHYYVVSISIVEVKEKECNDNDSTIFSIKTFGENINEMKLYNQLTMIVPNDWSCNIFAIYLCENVMKNDNTLFIYLFI